MRLEPAAQRAMFPKYCSLRAVGATWAWQSSGRGVLHAERDEKRWHLLHALGYDRGINSGIIWLLVFEYFDHMKT